MHSLLTTLLLADAIEKGGPGSGPQGGRGESKQERFQRLIQEDLDRMKPSSSKGKPSSSTPSSAKGLSSADKALANVARSAGEKLYGKGGTNHDSGSGLEIDDKTVERGSVKQYLGGSDTKTYDTFDYVFKPSTGKAYDVADTPIRASHADVDGKIYVAGSQGIFVITSGFGKK
jgi:hypothetical protein